VSFQPSGRSFSGSLLSFITLLRRRRMIEGGGNVLWGLPLSEGEQKGLEIVETSTQELCNKGNKCLVGRLGVPKKLNNEAFKSILLRIWRPAGKMNCKEIHTIYGCSSSLRRAINRKSWLDDHGLMTGPY